LSVGDGRKTREYRAVSSFLISRTLNIRVIEVPRYTYSNALIQIQHVEYTASYV